MPADLPLDPVQRAPARLANSAPSANAPPVLASSFAGLVEASAVQLAANPHPAAQDVRDPLPEVSAESVSPALSAPSIAAGATARLMPSPMAPGGKIVPPPGDGLPQAAAEGALQTGHPQGLEAPPDDAVLSDLAPAGAASVVPDGALAENAPPPPPPHASDLVPEMLVTMAPVAPAVIALPARAINAAPAGASNPQAALVRAAGGSNNAALSSDLAGASDAASFPSAQSNTDPDSATGNGRNAASLGSLASASAALPVSASPTAPVSPPGVAAPALALVPSPAMAFEAGAALGAGSAPLPSGLESALEQVAGLRDAARSARPELLLRHGEFGAVSLKIDASAPGEWRAMLASRDPGFVPAVHAALAERAVGAASDTGAAGNSAQQGASSHGNSARGGDGQGAGQGAGQSAYGSSPGSGQGSSQPYSAQNRAEGRKDAPLASDLPASEPAGTSQASGLFA